MRPEQLIRSYDPCISCATGRIWAQMTRPEPAGEEFLPEAAKQASAPHRRADSRETARP